jgi:hypothetical protein
VIRKLFGFFWARLINLAFLNDGMMTADMCNELPQNLNSPCYINRYNMVKRAEKLSILRYPRLDTVLMVEEFIRENSGEYKKRSLWEHLPRKTMYQTFCVIFDYLLYSSKIAVDREDRVGWIWNPELARKYFARADLARRK